MDKSIRDAPRASDATPILSVRPNAGITKAKRKQKALTKGQRRRQEKGLARAEVVQDQMAKKVNDASKRVKKRRERKGVWDEVNGTNNFAQLNAMLDDDVEKEGGEWVEDDMEEVEEDKAGIPHTARSNASDSNMVIVDRTVVASIPAMDDEIDEVDKIT